MPTRPESRPSLAARVDAVAPLSKSERRALDELVAGSPVFFRRDRDLLAAEMPVAHAYMLVSGWARWHEDLPDGTRQIFDFVLPGEVVGLAPLAHEQFCRSRGAGITAGTPLAVTALTRVEAIPIERESVERLCLRHPALAIELLALTAIQRSTCLRHRLTAAGRRSGRARLAGLLLELWERQRAFGLDGAHSLDLPVSQAALAELLGLTPVHVSRTVTTLEREHLLTIETRPRRRVVFHDPIALRQIAETTGRRADPAAFTSR